MEKALIVNLESIPYAYTIVQIADNESIDNLVMIDEEEVLNSIKQGLERIPIVDEVTLYQTVKSLL